MFLWSRGLLRARSRFPEIVENKEDVVEGMERLDGAAELAKQVLSQLSYTPTAEAIFILEHFCLYQNPFLRVLVVRSELPSL
jgi:hypothetical protein